MAPCPRPRLLEWDQVSLCNDPQSKIKKVLLAGLGEQYHFSGGCGIPNGDTIFITGGRPKIGTRLKNVDEYSTAGFVRPLSSLQQERTGHGCGLIEQVFMLLIVSVC